jgi:hypothetical protein
LIRPGLCGPVSEGSLVTASFSQQVDPSAADTAAGFRYSYDWDNDGAFEVVDSGQPPKARWSYGER